MTDRLDQLEREFREHEENQNESVRSMMNWLRGSIITVLGLAVSVGVFVGNTNMREETVLQRIERNETSIKEMDSRIRTAEINYADIKARLSSIETAILEIKSALIR
jgi:septal ring factor EnvC (AmiA/AmiB activator)